MRDPFPRWLACRAPPEIRGMARLPWPDLPCVRELAKNFAPQCALDNVVGGRDFQR
jgi:hypothetical protein